MNIDIKKVWENEQEILDVIDSICKENNLKYSLAYGSLIGAIRHRGFIPWDDDIDIMMPRADYNRFIELWNSNPPKGYIFQNESTDSDYTNNFGKVRKDNTTFLQYEEEREKHYHKGFFVDIFPGDNLPKNKLAIKIQFIACAVNLLFSRGFTSGNGGIVGLTEKILLKLPKKNYGKYRKMSAKIIEHWNKKSADYIIFACTIKESGIHYPADMFNNLIKAPFNGKEYTIFKDYDKILRIEYGDYMKLPPEEDRVWKHHPILIDFERNYEEL